jgi:predicted transcriptional regulator
MEQKRTHLEVLFPKVRAEILRLLFSTPHKKRYVREIESMTGLALSTVQDELRKLAVLGVIVSWLDRRRRFYGPNQAYPLFSELLRIVRVSERMPRVRHAHLQRPRYHRQSRKRQRRKMAHLPKDRPARWGLFREKRRSTA